MLTEPQAFFQDEASMLVFALMYLDGDIRAKLLGIDERLYYNAHLATLWMTSVSSKIRPHFERAPSPGDSSAYSVLDRLYRGMIR